MHHTDIFFNLPARACARLSTSTLLPMLIGGLVMIVIGMLAVTMFV